MAFGWLLKNNSNPNSFSASHGQDLNRDAFCTKTISQNISRIPTKTQSYLELQDNKFTLLLSSTSSRKEMQGLVRSTTKVDDRPPQRLAV
jgi:hypothetical protein